MDRAPVRLHPLAAEEAEFARAWYSAQNETVANAFLRELDAAIESIAEAPDRWPPLHGAWRRFLLRRFPFSVVYVRHAAFVEVIALAHHRRKPGYWRKR